MFLLSSWLKYLQLGGNVMRAPISQEHVVNVEDLLSMFPSRADDIVWMHVPPKMSRLNTSQNEMRRDGLAFFLADAESINLVLQDGLPSMRAYVHDRVLQYTFPSPQNSRQQSVPCHLARMVVKVGTLTCMSSESASFVSW